MLPPSAPFFIAWTSGRASSGCAKLQMLQTISWYPLKESGITGYWQVSACVRESERGALSG